MRKIQFTVIMSLLCSFAFSQLTPYSCFSNCRNPVYQTVIGQTSTSLTISFEDSYGNQVYPQTASFKIRVETNNGSHIDLASYNLNIPYNTVVLSNCGNGWYDVTTNTSGSGGGLIIVDISIIPTDDDGGAPIDKIGDDKEDYIVEMKKVILEFASGNSDCSSNADYCYCKLNRKSLINGNSILVSQNLYNNFLNIVILNEIISDYQNIAIELYDIAGKQVLSDNLYQPENQINIESLNAGFHLLIIRNNKELLTTKKVLIN